jgi:hypothetical protein
MAQRLDIFKVLRAIDKKEYDFYDNLTDEERKSFSAFMGLKWAATVDADKTVQHYYLASTNHYSNKYLFDINRHPKLQWLTLVASSPNIGQQRHVWLKTVKKKSNKSVEDVKKRLLLIYPTYKKEDIDLLSTLVTKKDLRQYDKNNGK